MCNTYKIPNVYHRYLLVISFFQLSHFGLAQLTDSSYTSQFYCSDTVTIDRRDLKISNRVLRIMLFSKNRGYSYRSTVMNEKFTDGKNDTSYWIINNYKRNISVEGKRVNGQGFYGDVIFKKSGVTREIRYYDEVEIRDTETNIRYFWRLIDGISPYGTWKYYRQDQRLKKRIKYYVEINGKFIEFVKTTENYNRRGEIRKTRKKIIGSSERLSIN